ncbi:hypothetical protein PQR57_45090 [Paraburkholderia dipogonis]|jgi:hypothetical protein|uniref:Uncharacterized protein n=1 Tax=Paraburkholderia dipogonis TaxID=1211383 RepID=A0ABW9B6E0_9BURK
MIDFDAFWKTKQKNVHGSGSRKNPFENAFLSKSAVRQDMEIIQ